jgi:chromate transport protein ChrA
MNSKPTYSFRQLILYFLKSGTTGFGAPVALVGAVIIIATRSILDIPTALIAIATIFALLYDKKIQGPYIILIAALLGILIKLIL